jgi:phosphate transport system substrate-binding protein
MMTRNVWVFALAVAACGGGGDAPSAGKLSGTVQIDGSSTVYPITEAVAEQFTIENGPGVRVTAGVSGTGGGFKRFCGGEIDLNDASRPITVGERELCKQQGIDFVEMEVAYDGIAMLTSPQNTWAECLTLAELKKIWEPGSTVKQWSQVRAVFPAEALDLYGPGTSSGTFDYFTEAVNGKADASRADYTASEDDNIILKGIEGSKGSLGYVGIAYYEENKAQLKLLGVDSGKGCIKPDATMIVNGQYAPLSRPLYVYVKKSSLARPEVAAFVRYYLEKGPSLVDQVGYIALEPAKYQAALQQIATPAQ